MSALGYVDFHAHILPGMDDGAQDVEESIAMLRMSAMAGITDICATSHFYPDRESPEEFLRRREESYQLLLDGLSRCDGFIPFIHLGAEIAYFPGMSECMQLLPLRLNNASFLLVEPPMEHWSDYMLEDIANIRHTMGCYPVLAHLDRYERHLGEHDLFIRAAKNRILVQVNAGVFSDRREARRMISRVEKGQIHFIGTDSHGYYFRSPNYSDAIDAFAGAGKLSLLEKINRLALKKILA